MNRKYKVLLILMAIIIVLSGCSNNSNKINVDLDKLKFNEEIGDTIGNGFGVLFLSATGTLVEWYNNYTEGSTDKKVLALSELLDEILVNDMQNLSTLNLMELKIHGKLLNIGKEIKIRMSEELKIEKEELLRDKNLKELSDEEFKKLIDRRENHINSLKGFIEDILENYFDY